MFMIHKIIYLIYTMDTLLQNDLTLYYIFHKNREISILMMKKKQQG
jgi:hypothetical protein